MSLLRLESVATSYRRGRERTRVLRDVSLVVEPGRLVSVYGERKSGKTTLLRIAGGFERPDGGRVTFAGSDLGRIASSELAALHRDKIGWVDRVGPRSSELEVGTYVALPLYGQLSPRKARRQAVAALATLGVEGYMQRTWSELPEVVRILCAVAHATIGGAQLLIADDPTVGLGILDRERVCALLREIAERNGLGVLIAVPNMPSMLHAHDVHLLARGRLVASSATAQDQPRRREYHS